VVVVVITVFYNSAGRLGEGSLLLGWCQSVSRRYEAVNPLVQQADTRLPRIIECFGLEVTFKGNLAQTPPQ